MEPEILSLTTDMDHFGGAQKVLMDVHNGIKGKYNAKVLGLVNFDKVHPKYKIDKREYVKFANPFFLNNKILIVHARNIMAVIMVIKRVFFLNTKILYVHHNVYDSLKSVSFFPNNIISISGKVTENLVNYFSLKGRNIQLIYNGIKDECPAPIAHYYAPKEKIKILYSARVNNVKRQLEIVERLKAKISPLIEIHFAGTGPDYDKLLEQCSGSINFKALGFVENPLSIISGYDYLMLYSIQEGLPIALIEGTMFGKPLLVNNVGVILKLEYPGKMVFY
ncbi:glycosyltransferase [Mucilaginibacter antarcticus]|uniref:glycosyltransferase n=1 Tax=Mucilaginibacter antarcticus TaxID=1855725 RepID=UPI0036337535